MSQVVSESHRLQLGRGESVARLQRAKFIAQTQIKDAQEDLNWILQVWVRVKSMCNVVSSTVVLRNVLLL